MVISAHTASRNDAVGDASEALFTLALYVAVATLSYVNRTGAVAALLILTLGVNIKDPRLGFLLAVFLAPIQSIFGLHDTNFTFLRYGAIGLTALSFALNSFNSTILREPLLGVILAFGAILVVHLAGTGQGEALREIGWYVGMAAMFFAAYHAGPRVLPALTIVIYSTVLLSGIVSALYLYFGMTWLIEPAVTLYQNLRLSGVQYNPNVLSKIAAIAVIMSALSFLHRGQRYHRILLPILSAILYATGSKTGIGGAILILAVWGGWEVWRGYRTARHLAVVLVIVLSSMAATHFAASISRSNPLSVLHELRIGEGYRMSVVRLANGGKKIEYKKVTGLEQTGQRERLWEAGVDVVRNHWLWGLGPAGLTAAMTKALNYPFTSPHNFALELLGAYGLLGGAIYIALILALWSAGITLTHDQRMLLPGGLIIAPILVLLLAEIVEPSLAFGYGVVGFWFWCFAGLLAATARDTASVRAGLQTVQPA